MDTHALGIAVLDVTLRSSLVLLAALGCTALMRRRSAAARHLVWLAALAAVLLLPAARWAVPAWRVVPVPAAARAVVPPLPPAAAPVMAEPAVPVAEPASRAVPAAPVPAPRSWAQVVLLLWATGAALVALRLVLGVARVWWMEWRAVELNDDEWLRLTDGLSRRLRLGRVVRLLRGAGTTVPMTWGVFRPVILLPGEADGWSDERRRVVLAHELAHVRRWDALTQWIAHLAVALYWFNPLVWTAARRLREEREHACDDAVLRVGARPADYADHLLTIVRTLGTSSGPAAALAMARRTQFEGRLLSILDSSAPRDGVGRAAGLATLLAASAAVVPLAAVEPAARTAPAAPAPVATPEAPAPAERPAPIVARIEQPAAPVERPAARMAPAARVEPRAAAEPRRTLGANPSTRTLMDAAADPGLYAEIIRAAEEIRSLSSRREVLMELLRKPDLSAANLAALVGATRTMTSDLEQRTVLQEALRHPGMQRRELPATLFGAVETIRSDLERRTVLASVTERPRLSQDEVMAVLRLVPPMRSNLEKRTVLETLAQRHSLSGSAREAYLVAARGIGSEMERATALQALVGPAPEKRAAPRASVLQVWNSDLENEDAGRRVTIDAKGVVFGQARWDVVRLNPGGRLVVEERRANSYTCRVEVSRGPGGEPVYTYRRDGRVLPFTATERSWMAGIIREFTGP